MRLASLGKSWRSPMRASPISGLLSATMISSEGTQFSLDFLVVEIHDRDFHACQFVSKTRLREVGQFGSLTERKLAHFKEPHCELKPQLVLDLAARLATCRQQVIWVLHS